MTPKNNRAPLLYNIKLCASFQFHWWIQTEVTVRKRSIQVKIGDFCVPCDFEIWWMTLENNSILHQALCIIPKPWVNSNWSYSSETLNSGQNRQFFVPCDFQIWWITLKTIGHLFYTTSSFVHHSKAMGQFKLELQFGYAQFGSKSAIFLYRVTLKFDGWPSKTIGYLFSDLFQALFVISEPLMNSN